MTLLIKSGLKINIKYKIDTIKNMIDVNNDGYPLVNYSTGFCKNFPPNKN